MARNFKSGDLVWAKMKGYSPWPGKIMAPPADSKLKKNHEYVFFFGSNNHAWIPAESIELHSEDILKKYGTKKGAAFLAAMKAIVESAKDKQEYHESMEISETPSNENTFKAGNHGENFDAMTASSSKNESQQSLEKDKALSQKYQSKHIGFPHESELMSDDDADEPGTSSPARFTTDICHSASPESFLPERKYYERPVSPPIDLMYQSEFMKEKKVVPTKKKIGFLGLNKIGQAIVKNLYHTGHSLIIWDQNQDIYDMFTQNFEIEVAKTPADVVRAADITFSCMSDSDAAMELISEKYDILNEMERSTTTQKGYVEMTSLDLQLTQFIGTEVSMKGGRFLEAPVFKSRKEVDEGTVFIQAAGDEKLYDDCKSCFDAITIKHSFISADVGMSTKHKIIESMLAGTVFAALAESLSLTDTSRLNSKHFLKVYQETDMTSPTISGKVIAMDNNNYTVDISLKYMKEQFKYGLKLGDEIAQRTAVFAMANEMYKHSSALKYEDHDVSAVYEAALR